MKNEEKVIIFLFGNLTMFLFILFLCCIFDKYDFKVDGKMYFTTIKADECYALRDYLRSKNLNSDCDIKK